MISPVKIWRNQKYVASNIGKVGTILSWTMIRVPPGGFSDQAPYPVVVVTFDDGANMTVQLVDYQERHLKVGQKVVTVVRRIFHPNTEGVIPYGIKVKPL